MQSTPRHKPPSGSTSAASTLVHTPLVHKCLVYLGDLSRYHATVSALFPPFVHTLSLPHSREMVDVSFPNRLSPCLAPLLRALPRLAAPPPSVANFRLSR